MTATADDLRREILETDAGPDEGDISQRTGFPLVLNVRLALTVVMVVLLGAAAGFVVAEFLPPKYAARAELQYNLSQSQPNALLREDRRLTTQLVLLTSRVVLGPVADANGLTPEALAKNVSADVVDNSEIIEVKVTDADRPKAQLLLSAIVARYLAEANRDWRDPIRTYLDAQRKDVDVQLQTPGLTPDVAAALNLRAVMLRDLQDALQSRAPDAQGTTSGPPARVLVSPYWVADRVGTTPVFAAATGATTALVTAALAVLLLARRRLRA